MRGLFDLNEHLLLSHPDFPAQHAYLACQTLTQYAQENTNSLHSLSANYFLQKSTHLTKKYSKLINPPFAPRCF
jgi:hypothetical protein